jgi:BirA family biotin operon repressor/biotin-[acetyl-CoA-carboxylase] ligase
MHMLNQNTFKLFNILNDLVYHDGDELGEALGISRAAIWKMIQKLSSYGIPVVRTKGKGYRLNYPVHLLDSKEIQASLRHTSTEVMILEKTASTNDVLKTQTKYNRKLIACLAETQTAGKGRMHRTWHSPFGSNIYLSLLVPFEQDISTLSGLSLVAALALCEALEKHVEFGASPLKIKWPNDLIVDDKKLAGILVECEVESNGYCQVIFGIGLNVNMCDAGENNIDQAWTSLVNITADTFDRNPIAVDIIDVLIDYLVRFSQHGFQHFIDAWNQRDYLSGQDIQIRSGGEDIEGTCYGINDYGHLKINTKDGAKAISSGDASLKKT